MRSVLWKSKKEKLIEAVGEEEIEAIVLEIFDRKALASRRQTLVDQGKSYYVNLQEWSDRYSDVRWKVLDWETAVPLVDHCDSFYAWTVERIYFVASSEVCEWVDWVPRYPVDCQPEIKGEG